MLYTFTSAKAATRDYFLVTIILSVEEIGMSKAKL